MANLNLLVQDGYEDSHDSNKENVEPEEATFFTPPSSPTQVSAIF